MCLPSFDCTPDKTFALGMEVDTVDDSWTTKGGRERRAAPSAEQLRQRMEDFSCLWSSFVGREAPQSSSAPMTNVGFGLLSEWLRPQSSSDNEWRISLARFVCVCFVWSHSSRQHQVLMSLCLFLKNCDRTLLPHFGGPRNRSSCCSAVGVHLPEREVSI